MILCDMFLQVLILIYECFWRANEEVDNRQPILSLHTKVLYLLCRHFGTNNSDIEIISNSGQCSDVETLISSSIRPS
jgi:hypothetical protein